MGGVPSPSPSRRLIPIQQVRTSSARSEPGTHPEPPLLPGLIHQHAASTPKVDHIGPSLSRTGSEPHRASCSKHCVPSGKPSTTVIPNCHSFLHRDIPNNLLRHPYILRRGFGGKPGGDMRVGTFPDLSAPVAAWTASACCTIATYPPTQSTTPDAPKCGSCTKPCLSRVQMSSSPGTAPEQLSWRCLRRFTKEDVWLSLKQFFTAPQRGYNSR